MRDFDTTRHAAQTRWRAPTNDAKPRMAAAAGALLQRKSACACGGGCPRCQSSLPLQAKPTISRPVDRDEREAERLAEEVTRAYAPNAPVAAGPHGAAREGQVSRHAAGTPAGPASASDDLISGLGQGRPLDQETRAFFEPRFGRDLGGVRVHTGVGAAAAAESVSAHAFTLGRDIVFGDGMYSPGTDAGRRLLAHELTHVAQQHARGGPDGVIRRYTWDEVKRTRELEPGKIPKTFNYELVNHKLIAHTVSRSDIDSIVSFVVIIGLSAKIVVDETSLKTQLSELRKDTAEGDRLDIDVTPFLPPGLRKFMESMEAYYEAFRKHVEKKGGTTPDTIFAKYGELRKKAQTEAEKAELERKQEEEVKDWYKGMPGQAEEYAAACHQFLMLGVSGTGAGVEPGKRGEAYDETLNLNLELLTGAYKESFKGKGPYRPVERSQVQVGDIAVFHAGKAIKGGEGGEEAVVMPKDGIIHSAIVIRVSGSEIELLEKTDPQDPMATRTVDEVLSHYADEKAYVKFLAPALKGMPGSSPADIGKAPPSRTVTPAPGKAPENTFVLFEKNTTVTRPHEDRKLFSLIARVTSAAEVKVHGYASTDGEERYNANLSAHRAAAVGGALEPQLPAGSKVELFSHGETVEFGSEEQARRAGVELKSGGKGS